MPSTVYDPPALEPGTLRVTPLGGLGEIGRNMTVVRVRRQAPHRRLRRAVPRGAPARRRPDPARLRADQATASTTSSASCSRTATRTTSARCRTCSSSSSDIPLIGSGAHARARRGEAQGAPHHGRTRSRSPRASASRSARSTSSSSRSTTRSPTRSPSRSAPPRALVLAHRRLQDGPAAARRPPHRPARVRAPRRGGRRPVPGRLDERRRARLHAARARRSGRCSTR